jgi:hypothetical protein
MLVIDRNTVVESAPLYFSGWTRQQKQLGRLPRRGEVNQGNIEFALAVLRCQETCQIPRIMGAFGLTRYCRHLSHKAYSAQALSSSRKSDRGLSSEAFHGMDMAVQMLPHFGSGVLPS